MLDNVSDEELLAELKRREKLKEESGKPKPIENPDFAEVRKLCQDCIDDIAARGSMDEDFRGYLFEAAMTACFGKDVWDWVNSRAR